LEGPDVDGRIIFKWIFKKWDEVARAELVWLRRGTVAGACESYFMGEVYFVHPYVKNINQK